MSVVIGKDKLSFRNYIDVACNKLKVELADEAKTRITNARKTVENIVENDKVVYGVTTGFGSLRNKFIDKEKARGSSNINVYLVVLYKKYSIPVSAFILTIIAVAVSSMKRRGGMGMNLAIGIILAFGFVFLDKVFGVLAEKSSAPPLLAVWTPNIVFGILAIYLLKNAKR